MAYNLPPAYSNAPPAYNDAPSAYNDAPPAYNAGPSPPSYNDPNFSQRASESVIIKVDLQHVAYNTGFLDIPVMRNAGQTAIYLEKSEKNVFCYHLYNSVNAWLWNNNCGGKSGSQTSSEFGGEKDNYRFSINCNGLIVDIALTYDEPIFMISLLKQAGDDSKFTSLCNKLRKDLDILPKRKIVKSWNNNNGSGMGGRRTRRTRRKARKGKSRRSRK
jgi:hypothetical protein